MNTFQILASKFWFDLMHWNLSIGPEKWPIFGHFLTFKTSRAAQKNTSNMAAATDGNVIDDVTCKSSIVCKGTMNMDPNLLSIRYTLPLLTLALTALLDKYSDSDI
jgi:hypothetical protein